MVTFLFCDRHDRGPVALLYPYRSGRVQSGRIQKINEAGHG